MRAELRRFVAWFRGLFQRASGGSAAAGQAPSVVALGDGSSRASPLYWPGAGAAVKGKWYTTDDGTTVAYLPTDAEMQAFMKRVTDAAIHHRRLPNPPAEWGNFSGWKSTTIKVAGPVLSGLGAAAGFVVGGPAGAAAGARAGASAANVIW